MKIADWVLLSLFMNNNVTCNQINPNGLSDPKRPENIDYL